jgi:NAD(P)-dependent dehydrogenase (short-subunit alcohol dehydrogenase family)
MGWSAARVLGLETARELAAHGATVVIACRTVVHFDL